MSTRMYLFYLVTITLYCSSILKVNAENEIKTTPVMTPMPTPAPTMAQPTITTPKSFSRTEKPPRDIYARETTEENTKQLLMDWLLTGCWETVRTGNCSKEYRDPGPIEYPGYDGWYNNVGRPELGAVDTPLLRRWPAAYEDGVYQPSGSKRPNPIELSDRLLKGKIGTASSTGRNVLLVFFGQQIVEEILDAQRPACPPEYFNIKIPDGHYYRNKTGHTEMPVLRTRYDMRTGHSPNNPRQQLNEITPFLDGGLIYGITKAWSDVLRTYSNCTRFNCGLDPDGLLATSEDGLYPDRNIARLPMANPPPPIRHHEYVKHHEMEKVERYFKLGNPRGNENPFLLTFGIIWFRWHNHLARYIRKRRPEWTSEKVYNEARKWVIASQQRIVTEEWLPQWLGKQFSPYTGYDPSVDPQIDQFFQAAAFRFGHTLVPPGVYLRDYGRNGCKLKYNGWGARTCNNYWMSQNSVFVNRTPVENGIDVEQLIMGMSIQLCEKEDHKIVDDLRGSLFGPLEFSRRDLMALNIQRARDHGLPDYNTARLAYNLPRVSSTDHFKDVTDEIKKEFLSLYNNSFDDVDIWIGGILETSDGPGELFQAIITDQFQRIRSGDRFWYKNSRNNLFTKEEIKRLEQLSFYDILMSVTKMEYDDIPSNPFKVPMRAGDIHKRCVENGVVRAHTYERPDKTFVSYLHAKQMDETVVENCTEPGTYDYFDNSQLSFILTYAGLTASFCCLVASLCIQLTLKQKKKIESNPRKSFVESSNKTINIITASEWENSKSPLRPVIITLNVREKQLEVRNLLGHMIRAIDVAYTKSLIMYITPDGNYVLIRVQHNYDLVLKFDSNLLRRNFLAVFEKFLNESTTVVLNKVKNVHVKTLLKQAITKKDRQKKLEKFFRVVFAQAFNIAHIEDEMLQINAAVAKEVIYTELTIIEFAEALRMTPEAEFVKKIFNLVDKDKNGFISFREFIDMLVIFLKGKADDKVKVMFDMYDINGTGSLKRADFINMLRSFMETVTTEVSDIDLETLVQSMMDHANLAAKETINFDDFKLLLSEFHDRFNYAQLEFNVNAKGKNKKLHAGVSTLRSTFIGEVQQTVESLYTDPQELRSRIEGEVETEGSSKELEIQCSMNDMNEIIAEDVKKIETYWYPVMKYLANKRLQIFWVCVYTLVLIGIFAERFYHYLIEREHTGLRRILGYGLAVTRGAASAMMFTYSTLLITRCENIITLLRETILRRYIPFDSMIEMHKYIACWALAFTVLHVIGHGFNFYHISTQTADDLTCLFRNYFHSTHELPKFHYWCWGTMTGFTGTLLTVVTGLIFLCSLPIVRRTLYNWFSLAHSLYPIFYILMILHGTGRLVQEPFFHYFFLPPFILFVLDKIITVTRKTVQIPILRAEILPSGVTCIIFPKPPAFQYKSGQWVRIACPALQTNEFHPFTLSSAPHESNLSVHIRAVGPWTSNIRNKLDPSIALEEKLPMIHVDGPYGESHQDWNKYDIAIMVGAGIGVTPFASILKDIVYKSNHKINVGCTKVYFLWVTRTQRQFEWLVDILRNLESADKNRTVSVHIFITQFYQKFDLRTILLYTCERHFQKISNKSLFTGLRAVTHFGRPKFSQFFLSLQKLHPNVNKIGVFSCGTPSIVNSVDADCKAINLTQSTDVVFEHHFNSI